jgi:predicted metal-binding membrane protein
VTATGMAMRPAFESWSAVEFVFTLVMWLVMMIGMLTPSATPIILLYARVGRQALSQGKPFASTLWFAGGYILSWAAFSLIATFAQWGLDRAALLDAGMSSASVWLGSMVLIAAGVYQWTPFKNRCLVHCQSPIQFIQHHGGFRRDALGSLHLGISHGIYCVGCCWALMTLLFVGGVMNVLWIALIAAFVLAEKVIPTRHLIPRIAGAVLVLSGGLLLGSRFF